MSARRDHARERGVLRHAPWRSPTRHDPERAAALESMFAVGNGYLGIRGTHDEGTPSHDPGVFLNGFHETWPISYAEDAFGFATTGQTIVGAPDGSIVRLFVDDEPFDLASPRACSRTSARSTCAPACSTREVEFATRARRGASAMRSRRLVSLHDRHLAAIDYEVDALDGPARIAIVSELVTHPPRDRRRRPARRHGLRRARAASPLRRRAPTGTRAVLRLAHARSSGLELACGMEHAIDDRACPSRSSRPPRTTRAERRSCSPTCAGRAAARVTKSSPTTAPQDARARPLARVDRTLDRAAAAGYDAHRARPARRVGRVLAAAATSDRGRAATSSRPCASTSSSCSRRSARVEGHGVAAKGLTGRGYEGQYFWDTEIYVAARS